MGDGKPVLEWPPGRVLQMAHSAPARATAGHGDGMGAPGEGAWALNDRHRPATVHSGDPVWKQREHASSVVSCPLRYPRVAHPTRTARYVHDLHTRPENLE